MKQAKIIIVEDDIENLDFLCCELYDFYELYPISDEQFTIDSLTGMQPNLIILDTEMKNVDIFAVYRSLKQHYSLKTIPILFVTHTNNTAHQKHLAALQITDYLNKPFNSLRLKAAIQKLLQ